MHYRRIIAILRSQDSRGAAVRDYDPSAVWPVRTSRAPVDDQGALCYHPGDLQRVCAHDEGAHGMAKSRSELMVDRLRELQSGAPDITASAVVSVDGLIMASALPSDAEEDRVSAMSAAMLSLGERIASELG